MNEIRYKYSMRVKNMNQHQIYQRCRCDEMTRYDSPVLLFVSVFNAIFFSNLLKYLWIEVSTMKCVI